MTPFDQAWKLLKAPIVEPIPGVKVGYQAGGGLDQSALVPEQVIDRSGRAEQEIGNVPYASNAKSRMAMMTPNEYFDTISPYTDAPIQGGRDDEYRWAPRGQPSRDNIDRIIQGLKEGKMIGAPTLGYGGKPGFGYEDTKNEDAWGYTGSQEGGHRMEALRQMGHANAPIPVLQQRNFHIPPAEKRKTPSPSYDVAGYEPILTHRRAPGVPRKWNPRARILRQLHMENMERNRLRNQE